MLQVAEVYVSTPTDTVQACDIWPLRRLSPETLLEQRALGGPQLGAQRSQASWELRAPVVRAGLPVAFMQEEG